MLRSNSAHYKHCADKSAEAPQAERFCSGVRKGEAKNLSFSYPRAESNCYLRFRKPSFYPLNYKGRHRKMSNGSIFGCAKIETKNQFIKQTLTQLNKFNYLCAIN